MIKMKMTKIVQKVSSTKSTVILLAGLSSLLFFSIIFNNFGMPSKEWLLLLAVIPFFKSS